MNFSLGSEQGSKKVLLSGSMDTPIEKRALIRESGRISILIGLGMAAKVMVDFVMAAKFGLGFQTDAFFVAYTIPLIFESLIYPACQYGFVPVFVRHMVPEHEENKRSLFSTLFNLGWLICVAFSIIGIIGANQIVSLLAPGLEEASYELAVRLTRILFLSSLFVGPVGVMRAYLNAHGHFTAPAMFELIRGLAAISTILFTSRFMGIESVALGFAVGAGFQFIFLAIAVLVQIGFDFRWVMRLALIKSTRAHRLFFVHIGNFIIIQSVMILQRVIGSFLPEGSISAISYGHRMASVVGTLLFSGVEVVSLSSLAADFAKGVAVYLQKAKETLHIGLRLGLIMGFPVATGIFILRYPITQILFERGAFDYTDTLLAAPVFGLFALSIPFYGHWLLLVNYLFAANRPRIILVLSFIFAATNLILAIPLSRLFGATGLAVTYVGGFVAMYFLSFSLIRDELRPYWRTMFGLAGKAIGASIVMGLVLLEVSQNTTRLLRMLSDLPNVVLLFFSLLISGVAGISIYFFGMLLFRVEEATELKKYLKGRWAIRLDSSIE